MIYPKFPRTQESAASGTFTDTAPDAPVIGICAPSAGIGYKAASFDMSEEMIHALGYRIVETPSVRSDDNPSACAQVRGAEFNSLFADPEVAAVIAATGGEYNIEMLPYIDEQLIRRNPKWFAGYSDPTNISFYMTTKLDIATIYGFNAGSFDWRPLHEYQETALNVLNSCITDSTANGSITSDAANGCIPVQHSYDFWDSTRDFESVCLDTPVSWDLYLPTHGDTTGAFTPASSPFEPSREPFEVSGRLIGGCTDVIDALIGTPYEDSSAFIERYADDGFIWYFDTFEVSPFNLYLFFTKMRLAGYLRNAKAIILGRVMFTHGASNDEYIDLLKRALPDIPFVWGADIGHTKPAMTLINGSLGTLRLQDGKAELTMELK